ncbi:hypothetical protein KCP73_00715 [Salmonella enterica subsp. enterica]|nr:hypothetical protein KCP73_00715 [Salmonella enterica subsp. enterica]
MAFAASTESKSVKFPQADAAGVAGKREARLPAKSYRAAGRDDRARRAGHPVAWVTVQGM